MPYQIQGEECLNVKEIQEHLGWSYTTVQKHLDAHDFPFWTVPGKGRAKFYRKSDVETMREPKPTKTPL